jgi:AcrR family transcriptional regulator
MSPTIDPVLRVRDALVAGKLSAADLTARRLGALLGKTTSVLYHHYGSLDGFFFAVAESGMHLLGARLDAARAGGAGLAELCVEFVRFGLEAPDLYALMFERRVDWAALRRAGALRGDLPGLRLLALVTEAGRAAGSRDPARDARMLFAGLHGLVSLALSGRANLGALEMTDEAAALDAAAELAHRLYPQQRRNDGLPNRAPQSPDDPRPAAARPRRRAAESPRQVGDERAARRPRRRAR